MTTFGARLKMLRGDKNGETFSALLGVNLQTLYRYERDERTPDLAFIQQLLRLTGASAAWTVLGEGDMFAESAAAAHGREKQPPRKSPEERLPKQLAQHVTQGVEERLERLEHNLDRRLVEIEKAISRLAGR